MNESIVIWVRDDNTRMMWYRHGWSKNQFTPVDDATLVAVMEWALINTQGGYITHERCRNSQV